ncbi:hypothetical protein [Mycobacterium shinjukuense]|nr:hypothetical protein [Mycobacterium shinjukuense]
MRFTSTAYRVRGRRLRVWLFEYLAKERSMLVFERAPAGVVAGG